MCSSASPVSSLERLKADSVLKAAMARAPAAASSVIRVASLMLSRNGQAEFEEILSKLSDMLPSSTPHRVLVSNAWLILATFKVRNFKPFTFRNHSVLLYNNTL